ncbi:hypothetical protein SAMN05661096_01187 [Marivirga sericea]|uniref:Uncharacterized protein n=1 Tax=Marivirga sericea TaxID=1028 RepID=A0A1X7J2L1_9BACT|nr:hypothetical protein [Marivirga sericea]SMG21443.1 hypothetical protein SAMN05661096_01187 [Marivirga sericea]
MPKFTIIFNDSSSKTVESESKESLITEFSITDATAFQEDVKEIRWEENNYCCIECISTGKIHKTSTIIKEE